MKKNQKKPKRKWGDTKWSKNKKSGRSGKHKQKNGNDDDDNDKLEAKAQQSNDGRFSYVPRPVSSSPQALQSPERILITATNNMRRHSSSSSFYDGWVC